MFEEEKLEKGRILYEFEKNYLLALSHENVERIIKSTESKQCEKCILLLILADCIVLHTLRCNRNRKLLFVSVAG